MTQGLTIYSAQAGDSLLSLQVHQKRPVCDTCDNTFIGLSNYTLPFIFTRPASANNITTFEIKDENDTLVETLPDSFISIQNAGDIDFIICNFQFMNLDTSLSCGHYYYVLTFDTEVYYSEMFRVIDRTVESDSTDLAVNGQFVTDLSGWTVSGATWISSGGGRAQLTLGNTISQTTPGEGMVRIVVSVVNSFTSGMEFLFGRFVMPIVPGDNIYYVPSGVTFTIKNNDTVGVNDLFVDSVEIFLAQRVECYNFIVARNSCNKNGIPYVNTGYADVFILDAELYEPQYLRNDEVDDNGEKDKSQTFMRVDKEWTMKTTTMNYEPLVDELNKLPANNCIYIFNDVWRKSFIVFEDTMDIQVEQEWMHEDKCDASVTIKIVENLVINDSCCEEIEGLECCEDFLYEYEEEGEGDITFVTITIPVGNCAGLIYKLQQWDGDTLEEETIFTDEITFSNSGLDPKSFYLVGSKFGCQDIVYTSLS
jgi:hypothetical protein